MKVKLEDVCERGSSNLMQKDIDGKSGGYPVYGAAGLIGYVDFYQQEKPYVAVVKDGAGIGRTMLLPAKSSVIGTMQYLLPKNNILPEYLKYAVQNMRLEKYYSGATIPHIYFRDYKNEVFSFAEMGEQRKVIAVLNKVERIIESRKQQLQKLDELIKARFVEMFGNPVSNPKGWKKEKLVDVCTKLNDGTHFSPESYETGDYKYVTAKNIKPDGFDFSSITYVPEQVHRPIYERCNPEKGDVLYIKDGATTGIALVNTLDEEFTLLSSVALIKQNRELMNGWFLCSMLNNDEMYSDIRRGMGGAAITRLTIAKLNGIMVIVPPIELQNRFAALVEQIDKSKAVVQNALDKAQLLFDSLMQEYFG